MEDQTAEKFLIRKLLFPRLELSDGCHVQLTFVLTRRYSRGVVPGENPGQCVIEDAKDANTFFA